MPRGHSKEISRATTLVHSLALAATQCGRASKALAFSVRRSRLETRNPGSRLRRALRLSATPKVHPPNCIPDSRRGDCQ